MIMSDYDHIQRGIIRPIMFVTGAVLLIVAASVDEMPLQISFASAAAVCVLLSFCFAHLRIRDLGDRLLVSFGPVPIFRKTIPYDTITSATPDKSSFISGWGIHLTPKGWLWNIGGFDCVRVATTSKTTLLGTDEPEALARFLESKKGK